MSFTVYYEDFAYFFPRQASLGFIFFKCAHRIRALVLTASEIDCLGLLGVERGLVYVPSSVLA